MSDTHAHLILSPKEDNVTLTSDVLVLNPFRPHPCD